MDYRSFRNKYAVGAVAPVAAGNSGVMSVASSTLQPAKVEDDGKNNGGVLGGIGYVAEKVGLGFLSTFEGIWDYTAGGLAKLFGADEWAEEQFANDWVNYNHADEWYDPSDGWKFAGDIASGVGNSLVSVGTAVAAGAMTYFSGGALAPVAAKLITASAFASGLGAAGNATKEAYRETGELGGKEFGYGALAGTTEFVLEKVTGGLGVGSGRAVKAVASIFGDETIEAVAKKGVKEFVSGLTKSGSKSVWTKIGLNTFKDFGAEAFEEGVAEIASPFFKRMTYDPDAQFASPSEVAYAAVVGGFSGLIMGGGSTTVSTSSNYVSGNKTVKSGAADFYINAAKGIAETERKNDTGYAAFKSISENYARLSETLEKTGGSITTAEQKILLGQIKKDVTASAIMPFAERSAESALVNADALAEKLNSYQMKGPDGKVMTFTAEQIRSGVDMALLTSKNKAERKQGVKQLRAALSTNSALSTIAIADATGRLLMDAKTFKEAALSGKAWADRADLNNFVETADADEIEAVSREFGIEDWSKLTIDELHAKIADYKASGKADAYIKQMQLMKAAKEVGSESAKPLPHIMRKNLSDGIYRYSAEGVNMALIKKGEVYGFYDYDRGRISRPLSVKEVNQQLKKYWTGDAKSATELANSVDTTKQKNTASSTENVQDTGMRYAQQDSAIVYIDGEAVVELNLESDIQKELSNSSPENRGKIVEKYLKQKVADVGEYTFHDGTVAIMDNGDINKIGHTKYEVKNRTSVSMDDIVKVAQLTGQEIQVEHPKFASFKYYTAKVKVGNDLYEFTVNVGYGKFDNKHHIYDLNQFENKNKSGDPILANPRKSVDQTVSRVTTPTDSISDSAKKINTSDKKYWTGDARSAAELANSVDTAKQKNTASSMNSQNMQDTGMRYAQQDSASKKLEERIKEVADSFGIEDINDYVNVQKKVYIALRNEGFFTDVGGESKTVVNKDSGMLIEINKSSIKEAFSKGAKYEQIGKKRKYYKLATIRIIDKLIENAKLTNDNKDNYHAEDSSIKYAYLETETYIDGLPKKVVICIRKSPQKNKLWVHQVYTIENTEVDPSGAKSSKKGTKNLGTDDIISDSAENSNSSDEKTSKYEKLKKQNEEAAELAKKVKGYSSLNAKNQSVIRAIIRQGRAAGMSESFVLSCARVSARSGLNVVFSRELCFVEAEGKYADGALDMRRNRIIINPEAKSRSGEMILLHELAHAIYVKDGVVTSAEGLQYFSENEKAKIRKTYAKVANGDATVYADEINAHFIERTLSNKNILERLLADKPTLKDKILDFFSGTSTEYADDARLSGASKKLYKQYKKLFDEFSERNQGRNAYGDAGTSTGGERFALIGRTDDGRGIYRSNYPENTPKDVKQRDIIDLVQNVWSKNPIKLNLMVDGKTISVEARFNPELTERSDLSKIAFGNRKGTASEKRITMNLSSDLYQIAEDSHHVGSKTETGKDNAAHSGVSQWHYFLTDLVYVEADGTKIDCYMNIDVKQNDSGNWFYSFAIEKGSRPADVLSVVTDKSATTSTTIISENSENSNTFEKKSFALPDDADGVANYTEKQYNEENIIEEGISDGRKETSQAERENDGRNTEKETIDADRRESGRRYAISFSDDRGRIQLVSEVVREKENQERLISFAQRIYQKPNTETQSNVKWHAEKEDYNLFFVQWSSNTPCNWLLEEENLFVSELTTEDQFVGILDVIKPIERNVDYNKIAHISEERKRYFLQEYPNAYLTRIPIQQFLDMTTVNYTDQRQIYSVSSKISKSVPIEAIKKHYDEKIYLKIDIENREVVNHEGRHRMTALLNAGNAFADVFVILTGQADAESYSDLEIKGQYNDTAYPINLVKANSKKFSEFTKNTFWREDRNIRYALSDTRDSIMTEVDQGYKSTVQDKVFSGWTATQIAFTNAQAGIEAVGKKYGVKNIEALVQAARSGRNQAEEMIAGNQYRIGSDSKSYQGEGLEPILRPIYTQGEEVKKDFFDYLFNYLNVDRMSLEQRSISRQEELLDSLKRDVETLDRLNEQIEKIQKKIKEHGKTEADAETVRKLREKLSALQTEAKHAKKNVAEKKKATKAFAPLENKAVLGVTDENGVETIVSAEQSEKTVKAYEEKYPEFKKIAEKLWKFNQNLNQYRVDTGLISQELCDELAWRYPHYVPSFRTGATKGIGAIEGKHNLRVKSTVKTAKGSTKALLPPDVMIARQVMESVRAGRINQLASALYEAAEKRGDTTYIEVVSRERLSDDAIAELDPTELRPKNNEIVFFKNGERITMRVSKEVFAGFEAFNPKTEIQNPLINGARAINNVFKRLVTSLNPAFLVRNTIRDVQDAGINTKYGKSFVKNYARATYEVSHNGKFFQLFRAMGGFSSSIFDFEKGFSGVQNKWGLTKAEGNVLMRTLQHVENANSFVELLPRLAEFISSIEAGNTAEQAILDSADVTTNFGRMGNVTKILNSTLIPFLNPSIQGCSKMIRNITSIRSAKEFASLAFKAALVGILPMALNMLMYGDDEDYEELREADKENNFLFKVGDTFIKIPRGRVASVLGGLINRSKITLEGKDADWAGYVKNVMSQVTPVDSMSRTIFSPFADVANNLTWYGTAIEGRQLENKAPKDRYDESTSSIAIAIGQVFNYSPKKIHYLLDQYSGVIGDFILPMTTAKAEKGFFSGNFTIDPATSNKLSEEFYKIYDEAQYAKTAGDDTAAYQVRYLNRVKDAISDMYEEKSRIQSNTELSNAEKLQQTRVIQLLINEAYKTAAQDIELYTKAIEATASIPFEDGMTEQSYKNIRFAEATRLMYGAERALEEYDDKVYEKCQTLNLAGIDYETLYSYYFTTKGLESDTDRYGEVIDGSKRKKIVKAINALKISTEQKLLLLCAKGYSPQDRDFPGVSADTAKKRLLRYILSLSISREEKAALAEACGYEVKAGKIVTSSTQSKNKLRLKAV